MVRRIVGVPALIGSLPKAFAWLLIVFALNFVAHHLR